jgi:hypothetical protein
LILHGFTLEQANKTIEKFIDDCYQNSVSKIIVVTGKGLHSNVEKDPYVSRDLSILKYSVPEFIENNSELMKKIIEIKDAEDRRWWSRSLLYFFEKKNYKINFERSVSFTKLSKFLFIYSLLITIFSPALSVAVKLISSRIFSIIV